MKRQIYDHGEEGFSVVEMTPRMLAHGLTDRDARMLVAGPELVDAICGLQGLIQLVCARPDIPPDIREALTGGHRIEAAEAAVALARGEIAL